MIRPLASAAVVGGLAWLLCAGLFGGGALAQRPHTCLDGFATAEWTSFYSFLAPYLVP